MFLKLSLRKGDSTIFFGEPRWELDGSIIPAPDLRGQRACALIHGYNVVKADGAYATIYSHIADLYDCVVGVTWPGSEIALAFWLASKRAGKAGKKLAECLSKTGALWDLEGHSLGAKVALEAVLHGLKTDTVILAAPAVDNESVLIGARYGDLNAKTILICYSKHDPVLKLAYRLAKFDNALGLTGPESLRPSDLMANFIPLDFGHLVSEHSSYKDVPEFYAAWRAYAGEES